MSKAKIIIVSLMFLALIAGAFGFINSNKDTQGAEDAFDTTQSNDSEEAGVDNGMATYENEEMNVTFKYPADWSVREAVTPDENDEGFYLTVYLASPEYKDLNWSLSGNKAGGYVSFQIYKAENEGNNYNRVASLLDGTYSSNLQYHNIKEISVDGQQGVEMIKEAIVGARYIHSQVDVGDKSYFITLQEDTDNPDFNDYVEEYRALVQSIKL